MKKFCSIGDTENEKIVPFLLSIKTGPKVPMGLTWKVTDPANQTKIYNGMHLYTLEEKPYMQGKVGSYEEANKIYHHAFCIPKSFCGLMTIENIIESEGDNKLLKYPGVYQIRSDIPVQPLSINDNDGSNDGANVYEFLGGDVANPSASRYFLAQRQIIGWC